MIGSGFSFHNMQAFDWQGTNTPDPANDAFHNWLIEVCTGPISVSEREQRLIEWQKAPSARYCHPRERTFVAAPVCAGMANTAAPWSLMTTSWANVESRFCGEKAERGQRPQPNCRTRIRTDERGSFFDLYP